LAYCRFFFRFPALQFGADFSVIAFSVALP